MNGRGYIVQLTFVNMAREQNKRVPFQLKRLLWNSCNKAQRPRTYWEIQGNFEEKSVFRFITVTSDVVYTCKKLSVLKGKKATVVDKIPPELVKTGASQLTELIATLFRISSKQSVFSLKDQTF